MAISDGSEGMVMPVAPLGGYGNGYGTGFGGDGWWIILLFVLLGGWGGGFGGYGNGGGVVSVDSSLQRGFDQASVMSSLGDITGAIVNGFAGVEISNNARQIADMQQSFALQSQLASCCCENRLATESLKYTVATENCADRYEAAQNTRDIIENCNRNNQAILDKICSLEIEAKNDKIADLERQISMASLAASQAAQTAEIISRLPASTTTA